MSLSPCPFCGGRASFGTVKYSYGTVREQKWDNDTFHYVNCEVCGSCNRGLVGFAIQGDAAEHWNKRIQFPSAPDSPSGVSDDGGLAASPVTVARFADGPF